MNTPTSSAPHICRNVRRNTSGSTSLRRGRTVAAMNARISSHETRIDVPAIAGAHMNVTFPALPLIDEVKSATNLAATYLGSGDQGPVHSATTTTRIANGASPSTTSRLRAGCGVDPPPTARGRRVSGTPPKPSVSEGRQKRSSTSSAAKHTSAPTTSGRYGLTNCEIGNCPAMYASEPTTASGHPVRKPFQPLTR